MIFEAILLITITYFVIMYILYVRKTDRIYKGIQEALLEYRIQTLSRITGNAIIDEINADYIQKLKNIEGKA